jgi:hypothetical protein
LLFNPLVVRREHPERPLRREYRRGLETLGESHPATLRTRLGLATELERTDRMGNAVDICRDVGQLCLNLDDAALLVAIEPTTVLAAHLERTGDTKLSYALRARTRSADDDGPTQPCAEPNRWSLEGARVIPAW